MASDAERLEALARLVTNHELYAAHCLKIKDKQGSRKPLLFNRAQRHLHDALEAQLGELGRVRAIVLKGRQQGSSTYVAGRFYRHVVTRRGIKAFIIAHEAKATSHLFKMVKHYQAHNPLAPSTRASNAQELVFGVLEGGYGLATAGTKDVGRSTTAQLLHASEFAFWDNAQAHMAGIGNTVADVDGTEIIIESTGNGIGNAFHSTWQSAEAGLVDYIPVFIPWFWQDEYRLPVRPDLELSDEDIKYQLTYGLDLEQMQWRANKIASYGEGFAWLFKQEYPATPTEAFQTSTRNPLINPTNVMSAVNSRMPVSSSAPLIIGCDPASDGVGTTDRTCIVFRRGRVVFRVEYHEKLSTMQVAGKLAGYWNEHQPDALFIDKNGLGLGIYDRLVELNIPVIGVLSQQRANEPELYYNKRAEMWWLMREWFDQECRIPNNAALISDVCAPQPKPRPSDGRRLLESKEEMAARGVRSPDGGDALALTFAEPVLIRPGSSSSNGRTGSPTAAGY